MGEMAQELISSLSGSRDDRTIRLNDGRSLGYAEYGDPSGEPMLFFHGAPGSRLFWALADEVAGALRVRVIAPDRPGMGLSDPQLGRALGDWPGDVAQLADQLGMGRFAVLGHSGGGPYACACARFIPERLTSVAVIGGGPGPQGAPTKDLKPATRVFAAAAHLFPPLARWLLAMMSRGGRENPNRILKSFEAMGAADVDLAVLTNGESRKIFAAAVSESLRSGSSGVIRDFELLNRRWGFSLGDITIRVHFWHGDQDRLVPIGIAQYMAHQIPKGELTICPGEGHFSLLVTQLDRVLREIVSK